jgi:hypothetical protein
MWLVILALIVIALLPVYYAVRWWRDDTYLVEIEANRWDRTKKNIQRLEHIEMPPPYDHVNCAMCREFDQVKSLEQPDLWEEYVVEEMSGGPVAILRHRRPVYIPDPPPMMYDPEIVGRPLDVRPAEYDYIGKPPKAIAQPETIRR